MADKFHFLYRFCLSVKAQQLQMRDIALETQKDIALACIYDSVFQVNRKLEDEHCFLIDCPTYTRKHFSN